MACMAVLLPGIPKAWPFKEELVAQLKAQRDAHLTREKAKREERRKQKVRHSMRQWVPSPTGRHACNVMQLPHTVVGC